MRILAALFLGGLATMAACGSDTGGTVGNNPGTGGGAGDAAVGGMGGGGTGGTTLTCIIGSGQCSGLIPQTCQIGGIWSNGPECPYACSSGACFGSCKPGTTQCKYGKAQTCGTNAEWDPATPCEFGCENGACRTGCLAGEFNCYGNEIQQCDPGPPSKWVPKPGATACAAASGMKCDKATGTCIAVPTVGTTTPTGKYYQFATFKTGETAFLGGYDVTSHGDYVYVNRTSQNLDVYKITLLDSDGDGELEANQHPDNPDNPGPVEQRTIELVKTYTKAADQVPLGPASQASLYAMDNDKIYMLGPTHNGIISEYVFASKGVTVPVQPAATTPYMSFLGYGKAEALWYSGNEGARRVYSYHEPTKSWVAEFGYPNLAGSHMDGLDAVVSPKTGEQYVYVSDMTSDFIGQYRRDDVQGWVQEHLFEYNDATSSAIEGFGFGTLNHFWGTGGQYLYELGGGDIQKDLEPCANGKPTCGPNLPECPAGQYCKSGCCAKGVR
ncbi:MAG: hypothetical protein IPM35_19250 [Myxococcales bacterium]|nr:hypothetical protein [Myxococcales bacterium]